MSFFGKVKRLIITDQVSKIYTQKTPPRTYIEWEKKVQIWRKDFELCLYYLSSPPGWEN